MKKRMLKLAVIATILCVSGCGREGQERKTEGTLKDKETTVQNIKEDETEKKLKRKGKQKCMIRQIILRP